MSLGTTYGFSLTYPQTAGSGGGGGQTLDWARDEWVQSDPFVVGDIVIPLSHIPISENAIQVWSQGLPLHPDDYTYSLIGPSVTIQFAGDPSTDTTNGEWNFLVTYPYAV